MAWNKGKPSGANKSAAPGLRDNRVEVPRETNPDVSGNNSSPDDQIPGDTMERNPNRNVDKTDATNAGGYRN